MKKRLVLKWFFIMIMMIEMLCGCSIEYRADDKIKDLDFTVVSIETLPEKCQEMILQKQEEAFRFVYREGDYMYICIGYGKQESSGYSISVNELYLTQNAITIDTTLHGPSKQEIQKETYPYVIVKVENREETVLFR